MARGWTCHARPSENMTDDCTDIAGWQNITAKYPGWIYNFKDLGLSKIVIIVPKLS